MNKRSLDGIIEKTCPECKGNFIYNSMSVYKIRHNKTGAWKYYCSYKCWRKAGGDDYKSDPKIQKELLGLE